MTVSAQTLINRSTGNGVTTVFPYTFKIIAAADIEVTVDDVVKTLNVDYTVSGVGLDAGGNVTMTVAPANATSVVRRRNMALVRTTDYQDQGELPATTLDDDIDATVLMIQQVDERTSRAMLLPADVAGFSTELPTPVPLNLLRVNSVGDAFEMVSVVTPGALTVTAYMETLLDDADAAAALATLGAAASGANTDITSLDGVLVGKGTISTNTRYGEGALAGASSAGNSVAIGRNALAAPNAPDHCVAIGSGAMSVSAGQFNVAVGFEALTAAAQSQQTAVGFRALKNATASRNTAVGYVAGETLTNGEYNTFLGGGSGAVATTAKANTGVGNSSLVNLTTGSGNIQIGGITSALGFTPVFNVTTENDRIVMGSTGVTNAYIQVAWTVVSDARDKTNFSPIPHGLSFINQLQPTAYQFKLSREEDTPHGPVRYGFKAQDILALEGGAPVVVDTEDVEKLKITDAHLIPILVKALQELSAEVTALKARL